MGAAGFEPARISTADLKTASLANSDKHPGSFDWTRTNSLLVMSQAR